MLCLCIWVCRPPSGTLTAVWEVIAYLAHRAPSRPPSAIATVRGSHPPDHRDCIELLRPYSNPAYCRCVRIGAHRPPIAPQQLCLLVLIRAGPLLAQTAPAPLCLCSGPNQLIAFLFLPCWAIQVDT